MDHWEDAPEDAGSERRRIPVLLWPGIAFVLLGFVTRDVWAFAAGGTCLVLASLQWSFGS